MDRDKAGRGNRAQGDTLPAKQADYSPDASITT